MSTTPQTSIEYYWKGGDTSSITADWYYTVGTTSGLTAGETAGIMSTSAPGGSTQNPNLFTHIFTMDAVRGDGVVKVTTIAGSVQTTGYVTPLVSGYPGGTYYTTGVTGQLGTGAAPFLGGTAGCWDYKEHWMVAVDGTTGASGDGWTGSGYYFENAVRSPHGGDNVWLSKISADSSIGLNVDIPAHNLVYGGWNGATWNGSTSGSASENAGGVIIRDSSGYNSPVGVTTGSGLSVHAKEIRLQSTSNYPYTFSAGSSLGYVLSEGTHSLEITDSTVEDLELRKVEGLNDTGQYGNFSGYGNTYNSSVSILGYASGRFTNVSGYGGSGGFLPVINIAPLYRDPITIDVDASYMAVAPAAKGTGSTHPYVTIEPVNIVSSASDHRRYIQELIQTPENSTPYGQVVGTQSNNPVQFSCGATVDNHTFGAGSLGVGPATRDADEITVIDGYISSSCIVNCIHPNNPRWVGFVIGETHGNTQEGYLVTDEEGDATFKFSRGHFVKANFGDARGAADSSIVSQSGGK